MRTAGWLLLLVLNGGYSLEAQIAPTLTVPRGHKNALRYYNFTPNDKYLVSTDEDHLLSIWDGDDGRQLFTFQDSTASFSKIEINNAGNLMAALTDSGKLYLIHLNSLKVELLQNKVFDFSMHKKDGTIFLVTDQAFYKYNSGQGLLQKIKTAPVKNPEKIFALSDREFCVKESGGEILILQDSGGRRFSIPGSRNMVLHDLHPETGFILCSELKPAGGGIVYYNIDARSRMIRSRITVKGQYRSPSCLYTSKNTVFLATGISEDPDGMIITNPPLLYSFQSGKQLREAGGSFVFSINELNLNFARNAYVSVSEPDFNLKIYSRDDLLTGKGEAIFFQTLTEPDPFYIACANTSRKVAVFNNQFLLPGIFPSGKAEAEGFTELKKMSHLLINFFHDDLNSNGNKNDKKNRFPGRRSDGNK